MNCELGALHFQYANVLMGLFFKWNVRLANENVARTSPSLSLFHLGVLVKLTIFCSHSFIWKTEILFGKTVTLSGGVCVCVHAEENGNGAGYVKTI